MDPSALVDDLFRRESGRLVAALTRLLGPSNLALAEDVVHDALLRAMQSWRFEVPRDPKAWILRTAKNCAIDRIRKDKRLTALPPEHWGAPQTTSNPALESEWTLASTVTSALSPAEDAGNQLAMMFSICDERLSRETHVTLILRWLCGLSPGEVAQAFLADTQTIERRLHRGRVRLQELGQLRDINDAAEVRVRQPSVMQALYLLFSEGYHGSDPENPFHPAMCADAIRLGELLLESQSTAHVEVHALCALFCFNAARLATRQGEDGVFVPLAEQDRTRWDRALIERALVHLSEASSGDTLTRWHLEAGIACEHTMAPSVEATDWRRIVELYHALYTLSPGPIVALNRGLAIAELEGLDAGREALAAVADDEKVSRYPFFWGALADIERRAGRNAEARALYERAIDLCRSDAERRAYERRRDSVAD